MSWHKIIYATSNTAENSAIKLPASKSISNRLLLLQYLCDTPFIISNLSQANDTQILKAILSKRVLPKNIDCQDAGTVLRFITCLCASQKGKTFNITGTKRLLERPMQPLLDGLEILGAKISQEEKSIYVEGQDLEHQELEIKGDISSQFITGLCLIASEIKKGLELRIKEPVLSMPYIHLTLKAIEPPWYGKHF